MALNFQHTTLINDAQAKIAAVADEATREALTAIFNVARGYGDGVSRTARGAA